MKSAQITARLAGFVYLLLGITSILGFLCVPLVRADAAALARMIMRPELLFRLGIVSDLISQICAVFLALLLYRLLSPINKQYAVLMVALFIISVPISLGLTLNDVAARILLSGPEFLSAFSRAQLESLAMVFLKLHIHGVFAVEAFWGLWLFPFGLLVFRSRFLPRILGATLITAGFAYVVHSIFSLLVPWPQPVIYRAVTMAARAAGELPMIFWLLIKGTRGVFPLDNLSPAA